MLTKKPKALKEKIVEKLITIIQDLIASGTLNPKKMLGAEPKALQGKK